MTIVPIADVYVDAKLAEDQLGEVRPGQSATLTSDYLRLVGDVSRRRRRRRRRNRIRLRGHLPTENATGNWIKVVQRVPVQITLDPGEFKEATRCASACRCRAAIELSK